MLLLIYCMQEKYVFYSDFLLHVKDFLTIDKSYDVFFLFAMSNFLNTRETSCRKIVFFSLYEKLETIKNISSFTS